MRIVWPYMETNFFQFLAKAVRIGIAKTANDKGLGKVLQAKSR